MRKGRYGKKKAKWRQQKLAVGTVQKIAKEIAKREDQKAIVKYCHSTSFKATTFGWPEIAALPHPNNWGEVRGETLYKLLASDLGGRIQNANMVQGDGAERSKLELRVHGVEAFGIVKNWATVPVRFEARLIYVPNLNDKTVNVADDLTPRFTQLFHSGSGLGTLKYQGYARRQLGMIDTDDIPTKFVTLDRKVMYLPAARVNGTEAVGGQQGEIVLDTPVVYKRFTLRKRYKMPGKKAFIRNDQAMCTNGNWYTIFWCDLIEDLQSAGAKCTCLVAQNVQFSEKAPMLKV